MSSLPSKKNVMLIVGCAVVGLFLLGNYSSQNKKSDNSSKPKQSTNTEVKPKPSYDAAIISSDIINPATLEFSAGVHNVSSVDGVPDCNVIAKDESSTYSGYDYFTLDKLSAGQSTQFKGSLTITKEGASFVTNIKITCK